MGTRDPNLPGLAWGVLAWGVLARGVLAWVGAKSLKTR